MKRRREQGDFDVFLNHRGPDVKATFVAHLEDALTCAGFRPFLDARSLMKGDPALESLDQALDRAKVHVAVVSRRYAESKYCLNELVAMVRSGKPVVPVFYGVEPGELRWVESGPFAEAFERHKMKGRTEKKVQEWRDALAAVAGITGFRLADYRNEALLKREVVGAVARLTPSNDFVEVEQYIVGLGGSKNKCIEALDNMGDQIGVLGLLGMGGVGKTTLAKVIYNHFVDIKEFMHMTFLEICCNASSSNANVSSMWCGNLQEQLLWGLLSVEANTSNYRSRFQKVSNLGPILVVIDNIHKQDQFEALAPFIADLHPGSRIIVTSRDRSLLKNFVGKTKLNHYFFDVSTLDSLESNMLFNWHAFQANEAPMEYKHKAMDVVRACGGLPLALKVIGSCLFDKRSNEERITIWEEAVDSLRQNRDVMDVLRWSYNNLSDLEKRMFVDITCLFYSKTTKEMALTYWTSCKNCASCGGVKMPQLSLRNLIDKSIIYEGLDGILGVHDLLGDLGQEIGREIKSHITCNSMEDGIAMANQGTIKTVALNLAHSQKQYFEAKTFAKMPNLHSLILPDGCIINGGLEFMSKELRLLQWRQMPYSSMSTGLNLLHMVTLDFSKSTNLAFLWIESSVGFKGCPNLHHLNLSHCTSIAKLPESIGQSSQLQDIYLRGCRSLEKLPKSIGQLKALKTLDVTICTSLKSLPNTIGTLSNLKFLYASRCSSLMNVPTSIEMLSSLEKLDMSFISPQYTASSNDGIGKAWTRLTSLKWGISGGYLLNYGAFKSLEKLVLCDITCTELPESLGLLIHLKELIIHSSGERLMQIECLPKTIANFKMLEELTLRNCSKLKRLPRNLGALISLEYLSIWNCAITKLPKSISLLSKLHCLFIKECKDLRMLPSSIRQLKSLKDFTFMENGESEAMATSLYELLRCGSLNSLIFLQLQDNTLIEHPKSLGLFKQLTYLTISCPKLQCLPNSIVDFKMLTSLYMYQCHNLKGLPKTLGALTSLKYLCIQNCPIEKLPKSMGLLSQLQSLKLTRCKNLKKLPTSIRQLHSLEIFKLEECGDIEAMGALTTLQELPIWGSTSITKLPPSLGIVSTLSICNSRDINSIIWFLRDYKRCNVIQNLTCQVLEEDETGYLRAYYNESSGMTCFLLKTHSLGFYMG